jgi:hypothetical protein
MFGSGYIDRGRIQIDLIEGKVLVLLVTRKAIFRQQMQPSLLNGDGKAVWLVLSYVGCRVVVRNKRYGDCFPAKLGTIVEYSTYQQRIRIEQIDRSLSWVTRSRRVDRRCIVDLSLSDSLLKPTISALS